MRIGISGSLFIIFCIIGSNLGGEISLRGNDEEVFQELCLGTCICRCIYAYDMYMIHMCLTE